MEEGNSEQKYGIMPHFIHNTRPSPARFEVTSCRSIESNSPQTTSLLVVHCYNLVVQWNSRDPA